MLDKKAATRFFRGFRRVKYEPRVVVTANLASYIAPCTLILPDAAHRRDKGLNNRAENSHQPTRERERRKREFNSSHCVQQFRSNFGITGDLIDVGRHLLTARDYRVLVNRRFDEWRTIAAVPAAV